MPEVSLTLLTVESTAWSPLTSMVFSLLHPSSLPRLNSQATNFLKTLLITVGLYLRLPSIELSSHGCSAFYCQVIPVLFPMEPPLRNQIGVELSFFKEEKPVLKFPIFLLLERQPAVAEMELPAPSPQIGPGSCFASLSFLLRNPGSGGPASGAVQPF